MNQVKMSMEFTIHPALWDATYVGRRYILDKPKRLRERYSWCKVYSGYPWFNTWMTEWTIAMQIAQRIKRMHAWNMGKEYGVVLVFFGYLAACTHSDLLAEQRGPTEQISTAISKWLYLSFTQQLSI